MANKSFILLIMILSVSMTAAVARELLLSLEMTGTITTSTELTLYTVKPSNSSEIPWAQLGDPLTTIPIPSIEENSVVYLGSYYLVNTGTNDVTITYNAFEKTHNLPLSVDIGASLAWVNEDGSVNEVSEKLLSWHQCSTPDAFIYDQDGYRKEYRYKSFTLTGGYDWTRGHNALELGIMLSTVNVDVTQDTPFSLQLCFYSEEAS